MVHLHVVAAPRHQQDRSLLAKRKPKLAQHSENNSKTQKLAHMNKKRKEV
jgi:hypothetical protein